MTITINGKPVATQETSLFALAAANGFDLDQTVLIKNGYQHAEDCLIEENDAIVLIPKGVIPDQESLRQMLYARNTPQIQEKLEAACVAIAGLGGIGSAVAISLARAGVGTLHLVDFDLVEPSNLNRQHYGVRHLGMPKTQALKQQIEEINPYLTVRTDCVRICEDNCLALFQEDSIVCEALDRPEAKAMLVNTLLSGRKDLFVVASSGMAGLEPSNTIQTKRISRRFYLCGDSKTDSREGIGLMAPRVSICAGHQANAILRILTGNYEI